MCRKKGEKKSWFQDKNVRGKFTFWVSRDCDHWMQQRKNKKIKCNTVFIRLKIELRDVDVLISGQGSYASCPQWYSRVRTRHQDSRSSCWQYLTMRLLYLGISGWDQASVWKNSSPPPPPVWRTSSSILDAGCWRTSNQWYNSSEKLISNSRNLLLLKRRCSRISSLEKRIPLK